MAYQRGVVVFKHEIYKAEYRRTLAESKLAIAQDARKHAKEQICLSREKHGFKSTLANTRWRLEEAKLEMEKMAV